MRGVALVTVALCSLHLAECTTLPALDEATGGIPVYDIVLRTKCELSDAFTDDEGRWVVGNPDYPKFAWLDSWTAQVDLTLQILDQATFAPGASFVEPLHNAYPNVGPSNISTSGAPGTTISAVSQSFAVAAGVSLNGQAQRTQTMTYIFSVKELKEWRSSANTQALCAVSDHMDLRGRLGLKEWFRQAVWPVASGHELLYAGYHQKPGATPQAGPAKPSPTLTVLEKGLTNPPCNQADKDKAREDLDSAQQVLNDAVTSGKETLKPFATLTNNKDAAKAAIDKAQKAVVSDQAKYGPVLDPAVNKQLLGTNGNIADALAYYKAADTSLHNARLELNELTLDPNTARSNANKLIKAAKDTLASADCKQLDLRNQVSDATAAADTAYANAARAKANVEIANEHLMKLQTSLEAAQQFTSKAIDPPIATIGQSVQFLLAYGGNITPTWTFVRFKGPNSPLFSSSGTRTHTLNITLGPAVPGTNTPNSDVKTNQFYLQINSLLAPLIP